MIFPNLNVVGHLAVPAGWGSCLPRLAIFKHYCVKNYLEMFSNPKDKVFIDFKNVLQMFKSF